MAKINSKGLSDTRLSLALRWWGLPWWGILDTPMTLLTKISGGTPSASEGMASLTRVAQTPPGQG